MACRLATRDELRAGMPDPASWLGASERSRLATLGTDARRLDFLAGRWLARSIVQRWCGSPVLPALEVAATGACRVAGDDGVFVSISHSGDCVACAVAAVPVGIDIERPGRSRDYLGLARIVHTTAQRERLEALDPAAQASAFLRDWTLKEAWLKARGKGLDFALMRTLEFADDPHGDAAVADVDGLVVAVVVDAALPEVIECRPDTTWRRLRTRLSPVD